MTSYEYRYIVIIDIFSLQLEQRFQIHNFVKNHFYLSQNFMLFYLEILKKKNLVKS